MAGDAVKGRVCVGVWTGGRAAGGAGLRATRCGPPTARPGDSQQNWVICASMSRSGAVWLPGSRSDTQEKKSPCLLLIKEHVSNRKQETYVGYVNAADKSHEDEPI